MSLITRSRAATAAVAAATVLSLAVAPAASAAPFMVKGNNPSLADWTAQMKYLLNPKTPDSALAINLESGKDGVPAAKFFRAMGNRNANWKWEFQGPTKTTGNISTAMFHQSAPGYPTVTKPAKWKKIHGNWRISNETLCHYIGAYNIGKDTTFCK